MQVSDSIFRRSGRPFQEKTDVNEKHAKQAVGGVIALWPKICCPQCGACRGISCRGCLLEANAYYDKRLRADSDKRLADGAVDSNTTNTQ